MWHDPERQRVTPERADYRPSGGTEKVARLIEDCSEARRRVAIPKAHHPPTAVEWVLLPSCDITLGLGSEKW
jgi:hypothetical protein